MTQRENLTENSPKARNQLQGIDTMLHVLVLANDALLAESISSVLAEEIDLEAAQVAHGELGKGQPYSVVIVVDEEESENVSIPATDLIRDEITLIVMKVALENWNLHVYESYQLYNPSIERVIDFVRNFSRTYLRKK